MERSCRSDSLGPCTCPRLRVSPSFRLLRAITKSCISTTFRGVYPNVRRRLCRRNLTSVTCQNVPGPPPVFLSFGRWGLGTRLCYRYVTPKTLLQLCRAGNLTIISVAQAVSGKHVYHNSCKCRYLSSSCTGTCTQL